jgi:hypothetical protein
LQVPRGSPEELRRIKNMKDILKGRIDPGLLDFMIGLVSRSN